MAEHPSKHLSKAPPIALTIAGSDSGGGAGIQADLKAFSALGVYGASVITAVTAQNTHAVTAVHRIPADIIRAQIAAVLDDLEVATIKIGMLADPATIFAVAQSIQGFAGSIVLDPVMVAKSGDRLLQHEAIDALKSELVPMATVLTPNLPEAAELLAVPDALNDETMQQQGAALVELGAAAVLMKGGHASGDVCVDWLIEQGKQPVSFSAKRIATRNTHGTGCTLSSSIAAGLAMGDGLLDAIEKAHHYLHQAILAADQLAVGSGHGPVHHFHRQWT